MDLIQAVNTVQSLASVAARHQPARDRKMCYWVDDLTELLRLPTFSSASGDTTDKNDKNDESNYACMRRVNRIAQITIIATLALVAWRRSVWPLALGALALYIQTRVIARRRMRDSAKSDSAKGDFAKSDTGGVVNSVIDRFMSIVSSSNDDAVAPPVRRIAPTAQANALVAAPLLLTGSTQFPVRPFQTISATALPPNAPMQQPLRDARMVPPVSLADRMRNPMPAAVADQLRIIPAACRTDDNDAFGVPAEQLAFTRAKKRMDERMWERQMKEGEMARQRQQHSAAEVKTQIARELFAQSRRGRPPLSQIK
jgi:hypothetical protein